MLEIDVGTAKKTKTQPTAASPKPPATQATPTQGKQPQSTQQRSSGSTAQQQPQAHATPASTQPTPAVTPPRNTGHGLVDPGSNALPGAPAPSTPPPPPSPPPTAGGGQPPTTSIPSGTPAGKYPGRGAVDEGSSALPGQPPPPPPSTPPPPPAVPPPTDKPTTPTPTPTPTPTNSSPTHQTGHGRVDVGTDAPPNQPLPPPPPAPPPSGGNGGNGIGSTGTTSPPQGADLTAGLPLTRTLTSEEGRDFDIEYRGVWFHGKINATASLVWAGGGAGPNIELGSDWSLGISDGPFGLRDNMLGPVFLFDQLDPIAKAQSSLPVYSIHLAIGSLATTAHVNATISTELTIEDGIPVLKSVATVDTSVTQPQTGSRIEVSWGFEVSVNMIPDFAPPREIPPWLKKVFVEATAAAGVSTAILESLLPGLVLG